MRWLKIAITIPEEIVTQVDEPHGSVESLGVLSSVVCFGPRSARGAMQKSPAA